MLTYAELEKLLQPENRFDTHRLKAAELFGVAYEDVTLEQRRAAKSWSYFGIYGGFVNEQSDS